MGLKANVILRYTLHLLFDYSMSRNLWLHRLNASIRLIFFNCDKEVSAEKTIAFLPIQIFQYNKTNLKGNNPFCGALEMALYYTH